MKRTTKILSTIALVTAAAAVLAACGGGGHDMDGMDDKSNAKDHNSADVMFAQMMIPHHEQAVEMAKLAADRAKDPEVADLAEKISGAQQPEIDTMTGWLEKWNESTKPTMGHDMPGIVSDKDMKKLKDAKGTAFDKLFSQDMIGHHEGAVDMSRDEKSDGKYKEAIGMAGDIIKAQQAEIKQMRKIVDRLS
ncbi:MAG TPA: DUF305 domain-containing protein [Stackebrandtia sp.]|jgi:uncharacterized protein (DUF305 family)|uniref:DUF305 domain-containing protein n=1 Tax=Stackebrandtia sp. TaxID=2023065 RepID=UPI002D59D817|nr:DUF305 domain-containing protein [Stackebrandtia sp.]HZE37214.1 DUF305 domain-containing protein [Stackebrandtia sp.]